jgi:hypothetical protein
MNRPWAGVKSKKDMEDDGKGNRGNYLALVAVIVAIALLYWLASAFFDWDKTQTCVGFSKRNCSPRIELNNG